MVGLDFLWSLYQNSGPALQVILILGGAYIWRHDIQPRLSDLEDQQETHDENWDEQELNAQERTLLLDDAHDRLDQLERAVDRLRERLRGIEQSYAADHGEAPMTVADQDDLNHRDDQKSGGD